MKTELMETKDHKGKTIHVPIFTEFQLEMVNLGNRTGIYTWGVAVKQGLNQLQQVTYDKKGRSTIKPMSDWLTHSDLMKLIRSIN